MNQTTYFHWGFILISVPNLLVIGTMLALFVAALLLPFPFHEDESPQGPGGDE